MTNPKKILLSGNEAIAQAAIDAGCRFYSGYPITPQNELTAYMARHMPESKGVFIQAESEIAAINMVFGASAAGARAMTSSSSPGISLKQEGISYLAGCELPAVIVNIMRGGPGLGNIAPSQSDYFQATKGGGHGDYHSIVLAPAMVQEAMELVHAAFDLADKYMTPVIILGDGMLGQMMEPVDANLRESIREYSRIKISENSRLKPWALTGAKNRKPNIIRSLLLKEGALEELNQRLQKRYREIEEKEVRFEGLNLEDAQIVIVAYGTMARLTKQAMLNARKKGMKVGLIRPISLWPFPKSAFAKVLSPLASADVRRDLKQKRPHRKKITPVFLVVEMSYGQMLEDVRLSVNGRCKVDFYGRAGGGIPTEEEIVNKIKALINVKNKK